MSHIHVCLVSDQPVPNLTTVLQFKPDTVVLLTTKDKIKEADRLERVVNRQNIEVRTLKIKPYDIDNVIQVSEKLINDCKNCEVSLNITGGTKIGTLGTFQAFYTNNKPIFYVNTQDNEIIKISPSEEKIPIDVSISIKDYLDVYGFNVTKYIKDDSYIYKRKQITETLVQLAIKSPELIGEINGSFPRDVDKANYPINITLKNDRDSVRLCNILDKSGLVKRNGQTTLQISNVEIAKYLRGFWFEEYVYMTAKSLDINEVKLNVEGKWNIRGDYPPRNEFDVLIAKSNRLFYISCKTANPDRHIDETEETVGKEYLYELLALGDRALGLFGKKMLASARPVTNDYVRKRAEVMKINLIDGKNVATMKDNLKQWLNT